MDREFGRPDYDPDDQGKFEEGLVFVIMPFRGQEMADIYAAIKDECKKLRLRAKRVDENTVFVRSCQFGRSPTISNVPSLSFVTSLMSAPMSTMSWGTLMGLATKQWIFC